MKKRIISLFLIIALISSSLVFPVAANQETGRLDAFRSSITTKTLPSFHNNNYVYPFGTSIFPSVVKGGSVLLQFKRNNYRLSPRLDDIFFVEIYHCTIDELLYGEDYPELVEYRLFSMSDFNNDMSAVAFRWTADSRYSVGTYCYIGGVCSAEGQVYEQNFSMSNMYVERSSVALTRVEVVDFRSPGMAVGEVKSYTILGYPYNYTGSHNFTASSSNSKVTKVWVEDGYLFVEAVGIGTSIITVKFGGKKITGQFDVKGVTDFTAVPGKTNLCVGETDTIRTTATLDAQTAALHPDAHIEYLWRTSNPEVVTAENGVVTAVGPGKAVINIKVCNVVQELTYTVSYHKLPDDTPVTGPTATQPKQAIGHCSVCGKDDVRNVYEPAIFTDTVWNSWYAEHVDKVYDAGLMNGTGEHTFAPNANVTRAMAATVLYRIAGEPEVEGESPFTDVPEGKYYTSAVIWAQQNEVVNGYPDGSFRPNDNITREQLAAILYRYAAAEGKAQAAAADLSAFPDSGKVHAYAADAMGWAVGAGLINGVGSGGQSWLQPANNATRAQFATIISRYLTALEENEAHPEDPGPQLPDEPTPVDPTPSETE